MTASDKEDIFNPFDNTYFYNCYKDLEKIETIRASKKVVGYEVVREIQGGMGKIFVARRKEKDINKDSKFCVLKSISHELFQEPGKLKTLLKEGVVMTRVRSPYVVKIEEVITEEEPNTYKRQYSSIYLKLPFCAGGSLRQRCEASRLNSKEAIFHLLVTLVAIDKLHEKRVIHRDLKPENILFVDSQNYFDKESAKDFKTAAWRTVIADFGLATYIQTARKTGLFEGTLMYAAPEQILEGAVSPSVDIWSWGLIAWEILTSQHPYISFKNELDFRNPKELAQIISSQIYHQKLEPLESDLHWLSDLIKTCLSIDPSKRPTPKELIHCFKEKVCLDWEGRYIGQSPQKTSFKFKSDIVHLDLIKDLEENYEWESQGEGAFGLIGNFGWVSYYQKLRNLLALNKNIEAINIIHDVLGDINSVNSVFTQLIENPKLNSYRINLGRNKGKSFDYITYFDMFAEDLPRNIVAKFIDIYLICLVNLIEETNLPSYTETISLLAELCFSTNILLEAEQICRLAQAYLLLGDFKKSSYYSTQSSKLAKTDYETELSTQCLYSIAIATRDFQASVEIAKEHITSFIFSLNKDEQSNYLVQWQLKYAIALIENGQYVEALSVLAELPSMDITIIMGLICRYYLNGDLYHEIWQNLKQKVFEMANVSPQKLRMGLECAWLYGETEFCIIRAQVLLMEPCVSLPMNRYYKEIYESFAEGKFPYFSFNEELLKTFEARGEYYYDLFYDCWGQKLDDCYIKAQEAIYNAIALARKMGLEAKVAELLKRLVFFNGVYKQCRGY